MYVVVVIDDILSPHELRVRCQTSDVSTLTIAIVSPIEDRGVLQ